MAMWKSGFATEDRVKSYLTGRGFQLEVDGQWDHDYKLDFAIRRFPNFNKLLALGVQITERCGETQKLTEFYEVNRNSGGITPKSLYIELESSLDLEKGGNLLIEAAILEFQFNDTHRSVAVGAVRIKSDLSFSFFDPSVSASGPARPVAEVSPIRIPEATPKTVTRITSTLAQDLKDAMSGIAKPKIAGLLATYYRSKGHGFVRAQTGDTYFMHVSNVTDPDLRERLNNLPFQDGPIELEETVHFLDGGKNKSDAKYAQAKDVRRMRV